MAGTVAKQDRLQALRSDIALKQQELASLRNQIEKLTNEQPASTMAFLSKLCRNSALLRTIPLAEAGNITNLLKAANEEEERKNKILKHTLHELDIQLHATEKSTAKTAEKLDEMKRSTGYTESTTSIAATSTIDLAKEAEIEDRLYQIRHNIPSLQCALRLKSNVLGGMSQELEEKKGVADDTTDVMNDIVVCETKIHERKELLRQLLVKHAELDEKIKAAKEEEDLSTPAMLQMDITHYKQSSVEMVEHRRAEDRILKAQDSRMNLLEKRIGIVRSVLAANGLAEDADARVGELMMQSDKRLNEQDDSVLNDLVERYSTIDTLLPANELVPEAIASLFEHDLKNHDRLLRFFHTMKEEKHDVFSAIDERVAELQHEREATADRLFDLSRRQEREVDDRVAEAQERLEARRAEYDDLVKQNAELARDISTLQGKFLETNSHVSMAASTATGQSARRTVSSRK